MALLKHEDEPPHSLPDALAVLKQWENGQINDLSPDGIAVALFLQRARLGGQVAATATTELSAV